MWIRAANWLGAAWIQLRVLRAGRAVNDTAQKARAVTPSSGTRRHVCSYQSSHFDTGKRSSDKFSSFCSFRRKRIPACSQQILVYASVFCSHTLI